MRENKDGSSPARRSLALGIATAAGAGYAPVAPGTAGAAAAVPLFLGLLHLPPAVCLAVLAGLLLAGTWAAGEAERIFAHKDDGRIVIDEVVGQLVSLLPLFALRGRELGSSAWTALVVTGFVAFRCFDIWKPAPVRWAERRFAGGAGVMLDDVMAGLLAAAVLAAAVGATRGLA